MNTNDTAPFTMPLEDLDEFALNPRRGIYRGMATLIADIRERGIITPLVVWFNKRLGRWNVLQGNRRRKAALEIGLEEAPVIVREAKDEGEALKILMGLQLEHDEFDPLEEAIGVRSLLDLDSTAREIGTALHRSETWVQLRLDALKLPDSAQDALAKRQMDWETVHLLMRVDAEERTGAVESLLQPELGIPLQGEAAHRWIEQEWIERSEARRMWGTLVLSLRKRFKPRDGFSVLEDFSQWSSFAANAYGQPLAGWRHADEMIDRRELSDADQRITWGELAKQHEHAVHVVPAWKAKDGFICLVNERVIRDAEALLGEQGGKTVLKQKPSRGAKSQGPMTNAQAYSAGETLMSDNDAETSEEAEVNEGGEGWTLYIDSENKSRPRWFPTLDAVFSTVRHAFEYEGAITVTIDAGPVAESGRSE